MSRKYHNTTLQGDIVLDGATFEKVTFKTATLIFKGGNPPVFTDCAFHNDVRFSFDGPAGNTVAFIRSMRNNTRWSAMVKQMLGLA